MITTTSHHTPAAAGVSVSEPAMANQLPVTPEEDEAFEALARRNDELEDQKHEHLSLIDHQMRAMVRMKQENCDLRSSLGSLLREAEEFAKVLPPYGNSDALINARLIIEQTKI